MERSEFKEPDGRPTGKQIYLLATELCRSRGEEFPATRFEASELIDRLRAETATPAAKEAHMS